MEEYTSDISVIDVYELASGIGKEFEKVIDLYGAEAVTNLMPKVISALEHLESLATKNERENTLLDDLRNRIMKLENEKHTRAEERLKFEKELEQIEEDWRKESNHLLTVIAKLQDENKRLTTVIANKSSFEQDCAITPYEDVNVINQLQHQVDQLREKVKLQNIELNSKCTEIENLEDQIEHLNSNIVDLKRKQKVHASQINGFVDERSKLFIEVQEQRREINLLHQRLGIVQRENEDLAKSNVDMPDLRNKVLYDVDDPDRPRFTTDELKEILHERNELKARLSELQDELSLYRPEAPIDTQQDDFECQYNPRGTAGAGVYVAMRFPSNSIKKGDGVQQSIPSFFPPNIICAKSEIAVEIEPVEPLSDDELPVQGPIPFEPDDAPWKRSESGIRKLFRKLFIEPSVNPVRKIAVPTYFSSRTSSSSSPTPSATSNLSNTTNY
ncbi:hypothetical protein V9T40_000024 [Parthenolecanium corni]|uniref:RILP-like protein n=1 Tax=Parthenolecanium corni TaxID=536013 RepID=A0AAN9Y455_9HEMI